MDPVSMAIMAMASAMKGITAFFGNQQAAKQEEFNANTARQEAQVQANMALEQGDRVQAQAAVGAAASGGGTEGSALSVLDDLGRQSMFKARNAIYEGNAEANARLQHARQLKAEGRRGLVGAISPLAGSFLSGAGEAAQNQRAASAAYSASQAGQAGLGEAATVIPF